VRPEVGAIISTELLNDFKAQALNFKSSAVLIPSRERPFEISSRHQKPVET
jgi:hypothetical protein